MQKSIIIIGAGMGGLASGIFGQLNDYRTQIFEMHTIPGGQCTSWKRKGYTFDVCIHHLFGCSPGTKINGLWKELGAMPRELVYTEDCVSVVSPDGIMFHDFYDIGALERQLMELSPADKGAIKDYVNGIQASVSKDLWGELILGSISGVIKTLPAMLPLLPFFRLTMQQFAQRFSNPFLKNNKATGVRLSDGSEYRADFVISDADGRKTIMQMLDGKYIDERIRAICTEPPDETNWAVHVFLGVNRDLSKQPSALVMLLDRPIVIAGHENRSLEMQIYGFDKTMAPEGRGVIKVELISSYSYWKKLYSDRMLYDEEKQKVAEIVIGILENHFPGIKSQVEEIDVPTLMTWERYMGGTHGFANMPAKKSNIIASLLGREKERTLPGLSNFYFVGAWATSTGALFSNANSGKKVIKTICSVDGKRFIEEV
jgi:phytoene dehydrogenase-like protein